MGWLWTGVDGGFRGGWWWLWWSCGGEQDEESKTWMGEEAILSLSFSDQLGHGSLFGLGEELEEGVNGGASVVEPVLVWPKSDWCGVVGKVLLELVRSGTSNSKAPSLDSLISFGVASSWSSDLVVALQVVKHRRYLKNIAILELVLEGRDQKVLHQPRSPGSTTLALPSMPCSRSGLEWLPGSKQTPLVGDRDRTLDAFMGDTKSEPAAGVGAWRDRAAAAAAISRREAVR
uniref:Uncharacterized protein n=1 Tax=Fagus sylvatica TaxID=28930 RepID=A0A2N9EVD3_FAGSY